MKILLLVLATLSLPIFASDDEDCAKKMAGLPPDEELVEDPRGRMRPSEIVEEKLRKLLESSGTALPLSHTNYLLRRRP